VLYYYLMSQLPYLYYDQKAPMSSEAFKEITKSQMSKNDAALIDYLSLDTDDEAEVISTGCDFIDAWRSWERALRFNLARYRSLKLFNDVAETAEPPVVPADAVTAAAAAFTQDGSPLDGEILIDKARWAAIDLLTTGIDYFHKNNAFAYYLKLLLLERRQLFNAETGFSEYKSLYAEIMENGQSCVSSSAGN